MNKDKSKIPEAEQLLNEQLEIAGKTKISDIITLSIFCLLVFALAVAFWIVPDKQTSVEERRQLKQLPEISFGAIRDEFKENFEEIFMTAEEREQAGEREAISDEIAEYYADQFPLRNALRTIKAGMETFLGKKENNDVIFADDGYLVKKDTLPSSDLLDKQAQKEEAKNTVKKNTVTLNMLDNMLKEVDSKLVVAVAGRSVDVMESKIPSYYPYDEEVEEYWDIYNTATENAKYGTVELRDLLSKHVENDEYVYYRTDHHWTSLGAYYAYCEIISSFGQTPLAIDDFNITAVTDDFYGTTYAKAGASFKGGDEINLFRFDGDEEFTTKILDGSNVTEYKGFYNYKYLQSADKYSLFFGHDNESAGGNSAVTYVTKDTDEERKTLVLIKDSFANTIAPFLAYHYDLIILDMRSYQPDGGDNKTVTQIASEPNVEGVLVLYNMETFMNDTSSLFSTLITN